VLSRLQTGVSLIEVIIGLAIMALLLVLGVPQYATFLANARLKTTTDTLASGLNLARAEAVKRNARVEFVLTDEEPIAAVVNALAPSTTGINWVVREWVPTSASYNFIEGKAGAEGSGRVDATSIVITPVTAGTFDGRVTFTGFGSLASAQAIQFQITNPSGGACDTTAVRGPMRCLNINVSPGGQIRVCDPKVTAAKDTRAC
jgi:type IV fimbrial biogenesis protein FimT